jgi:hypothetical protein
MIASGGLLAILYGTKDVNGFLAVNVGASAPLAIRGLMATVPPPSAPPERLKPNPNPITFIAGTA